MDKREYIKEILEIIHSLQQYFPKIFGPIIESEGLNTMQIFLLFNIRWNRYPNVGVICKNMNINQGNASILCKKLEQMGYIIRKRDNDDERIVSLSLTEEGNKILDNINEKLYNLIDRNNYITIEKLDVILNGFSELKHAMKSFSVVK